MKDTHEHGNLPHLPAMFGLDALCECGEVEAYHNTFPGEDGRCTVFGSTCKGFRELSRKPAGIALNNNQLEQIA